MMISCSVASRGLRERALDARPVSDGPDAREVSSDAAAIARKQSPVISCVSKNEAWVKPSSSARCANLHESLEIAMPIPKLMAVFISA
jgi:hypothetical protein